MRLESGAIVSPRFGHGHAGRQVWKPIVRHVTTPDLRGQVLAGMDTALTAVKLFYQGICIQGDRLDAGGTVD